MASLAKKAHGMSGTLSRMRSGSGGYFCMSGTRSWTTVRTNDVHRPMRNRQAMLTAVLRFSPRQQRIGVSELAWKAEYGEVSNFLRQFSQKFGTSSYCFESPNSLKNESRSGVADLSWFEVETGEELGLDFLIGVFSCWIVVCRKSRVSSQDTLLLLPRKKSNKR